MEPTINRILHHVYGAYHYAYIMVGADESLELSWIYGDTIDHCDSCSGYVAMGPKPVSFWREEAKRGYYPQSPLLACGGYHCKCGLR